MVDLHRVEIVFANVLKIMEVAEEPPPRGHSQVRITFDGFVITAEGEHVMYTLPVDHTVKMQVGYVDAAGNPATVDGAVVWQSSDVSIVSVSVDPTDSTICRAIPVGSLGQAQITATADADLGQGVRGLITTCEIEIVGGEAVAGSIQPVGEPEPIGHPEPRG
ncbi:hypothetical protein SAMN05443247_06569 [Bradyrhizobium erythrophlei]|nr:hypothetical protein SAMN05443247_06569 [Bradyrhizobium erythrophlei]